MVSVKALCRFTRPPGLRATSTTSTFTARGSTRYASKATSVTRRSFSASVPSASAIARTRVKKPLQHASKTVSSSSSLFLK
jgi:hypothetical protein